jgi:hypothetical protein
VPSTSAIRIYERRLLFLGSDPDSALVVPWFFTARAEPDAVVREIRGWLARAGTWEPFFRQGWRSGPARAPWRLLPYGPVRLVVGPGDALEDVIFQEGARQLHVSFGSLLADWTSPGGDVYRIHEAGVQLATGTVEGILLDLSRTRGPGGAAGEWGLLLSGDSLQLVVDGVRVRADGEVGDSAAVAWARLDFRRLQWPALFLVPDEVLAYERARRDVPVSWRIRTPDGSVEGMLRVETTEIEAGRGSGPFLPVYALFEVSGELLIEGRTYPVRGVLRHLQP